MRPLFPGFGSDRAGMVYAGVVQKHSVRWHNQGPAEMFSHKICENPFQFLDVPTSMGAARGIDKLPLKRAAIEGIKFPKLIPFLRPDGVWANGRWSS